MMYKIVLNTKQEIIIDATDYEKFTQNLSSTFVRLKSAVINPSYVVVIIPVDKELPDNIDGYIDEKTGKFIITNRESSTLPDEFPLTKQLADKMRI